MNCSRIKILIYSVMVVMLLFTPLLLDISQDGKTYAFSSKKGNNISGFTAKTGAGGNDNTFGYEKVEPNPATPAPVPEPATMLLVGGGMLGLAAFRKKFKKK